MTCIRDRGWQQLDDGQLLDAVTDKYDVLLTVDASIPYQQLISERPLAVVILRARSNRAGDVDRLAPALQRALK